MILYVILIVFTEIFNPKLEEKIKPKHSSSFRTHISRDIEFFIKLESHNIKNLAIPKNLALFSG
jgi:hypothetical protein